MRLSWLGFDFFIARGLSHLKARGWMGAENFAADSSGNMHLDRGLGVRSGERRWYAVFTAPQSEKSVVRHLSLREIETFLPTYETVRLWKNRQRVKTILPLFPTYLFVHISSRERV
jgi:hypothetical protein